MIQEPDKALDALETLIAFSTGLTAIPQSRANELDSAVRNEITSLRAEVKRLEDRIHEAEMQPWPKWADNIRKKLMEYGYDAGPEEGWDIGVCMDSWIDGCLENESAERDLLTAELEAAREALLTIHNWLVCSAIATPEDMAQSFEYMEQVCAKVLHATPEGAARALERKL